MTTIDESCAPGPVGLVEMVRGHVASLVGQLWAARRPGELLDMVRGLESLKATVDAVELAVIAEVEATNAAAVEQWSSARDFVTHTAGGRKSCGPQAVRLAGALQDLPATYAALAEGWLSREQARVVVRVVELLPLKAGLRAEGERRMLDLARRCDASELEQAGGAILAELDPDGCERREEKALARHERAAHHGRFLSLIEDHLGGVVVKGRGSVEDAAVIKAALLSLTRPDPVCPDAHREDCACRQGSPDPAGGAGSGGAGSGRTGCDCGCDGSGRDPREFSVRLWDAWVQACQRLVDAGVLPECHGVKPRIAITVAYADLLAATGTATLATGETLSVAAVRRLACDAQVFPVVLGTAGELLDMGRVARLVTPAIWRALVARDGHCRFPGCSRPAVACDAHHIRSWLDGGETALDNLVLLCRAHHTAIHQTPWTVQINPADRQPEFIPPPDLDPHRRPIRRRWRGGTAPPDRT